MLILNCTFNHNLDDYFLYFYQLVISYSGNVRVDKSCFWFLSLNSNFYTPRMRYYFIRKFLIQFFCHIFHRQ